LIQIQLELILALTALRIILYIIVSDTYLISENFVKPKIVKMVKQCATLAELKEQLKAAGDKLVVIDFFATWCGPCKVIAPQIEDMDGKMPEVVFLKVDVDENEDAAQEYSISAMPTFIFVKKEAKIADMMGANADKLKAMVEQHK